MLKYYDVSQNVEKLFFLMIQVLGLGMILLITTYNIINKYKIAGLL